MLNDEEISAVLGYATIRGLRDKVLLQVQEQATRKEVAMVMDEVCPHRKVMGMPVARWTCSQCMYRLWKSLTEGVMPKEML